MFDTLTVVPAGSWSVRLFSSNPDVTLADDDVTLERGYPLNAQISIRVVDEELYVRNFDSNDSHVHVLIQQEV